MIPWTLKMTVTNIHTKDVSINKRIPQLPKTVCPFILPCRTTVWQCIKAITKRFLFLLGNSFDWLWPPTAKPYRSVLSLTSERTDRRRTSQEPTFCCDYCLTSFTLILLLMLTRPKSHSAKKKQSSANLHNLAAPLRNGALQLAHVLSIVWSQTVGFCFCRLNSARFMFYSNHY